METKFEEEDVLVHAGFGKRIKKTPQNRQGWEECFFEDTKINKNKKTVLYFGGNGTVQPGHANFGCKFVEGLVGKAFENDYDLFGFYYTHHEKTIKQVDEKTGEVVIDENGIKRETVKIDTGGFDGEDTAKVYNSFLKPLLCDEQGKVFNEKQIAKNLSNLRVFAYCKGAEETEILLSNANEFLKSKFGAEKSKNLLSNVLIVSFAPWSKTSVDPQFGTHVAFKSLRDVNTKEPWLASKQGWGYEKDEPFLGVAKTDFNKSKNGIEVFSNSFVSVEDMTSPEPYDPHMITSFLKTGGVIDRKQLPGYEPPNKEEKEKQQNWKEEHLNQDLIEKRPKGYSRQQAIADLMGSALAYGLTTDELNLNDIKTILDAQLKNENKVLYEKKQEKLFKDMQKKDKKNEAKEIEKALV